MVCRNEMEGNTDDEGSASPRVDSIGNSPVMLVDESPIITRLGRNRSRDRRSSSIFMSKMWMQSSTEPFRPAQKARCQSPTCSGEIVTARWKILSVTFGGLPRMFVTSIHKHCRRRHGRRAIKNLSW